MKELIYSQEDLDLILSMETQEYEDKINNLQSKIESLEEDVEYWKEKYEDLENQINNDYDPEIEIPEIHGERISW